MNQNDREKRAELRRLQMTIMHSKLEDSHIDRDQVFGGAAISLAALLTKQSWALGGYPFPKYSRREIPILFSVTSE